MGRMHQLIVSVPPLLHSDHHPPQYSVATEGFISEFHQLPTLTATFKPSKGKNFIANANE